MSSAEACWNCGGVKDVKRASFAMNLPTVALCGICRLALSVSDYTVFERRGKRKGKRNA